MDALKAAIAQILETGEVYPRTSLWADLRRSGWTLDQIRIALANMVNAGVIEFDQSAYGYCQVGKSGQSRISASLKPAQCPQLINGICIE